MTEHAMGGRKANPVAKYAYKYWEIWLFLLPTIAYYFIFAYIPMYGAQIAFKNFVPVKGIAGSAWVGVRHFIRFFESPYFFEVLTNTIALSLYSLAMGFPLPILFAVLLNYQRCLWFKKLVQTASYAPHFISTVVVVGMIMLFLSPTNGIINIVIRTLGGNAVHFLAHAEYFRHIYVWSGIWQGLGWGAIIYIGALSAINPELHEAAIVDGASIWKRIWHIDLPGILPTIIIMLIMNTGSILSVGFEKVYLMQNDMNTKYSEVISTYVYKTGIVSAQYSYASAIGLFNAVVNFCILTLVNTIARKVSSTSLF